MLADVEARRSALKTCGYEMVDRLVGSLFHCLSVAGKMNSRGLGGLLIHEETLVFPTSGLIPLTALVYGDR